MTNKMSQLKFQIIIFSSRPIVFLEKMVKTKIAQKNCYGEQKWIP